MKKNKDKYELNWQNNKLSLSFVKNYKGRNNGLDQGYGVFAKSPIKKGEILTIFGGYIIPIKKIKKLEARLEKVSKD
jgi:hypothetical protein